jgi:maleylacetoacetate isomerase
MKLYTFWRSQAAFRVRIALGLKRVSAEMVYIDLLKGEQAQPDYWKLNPAMLLPTLIDDDACSLVQSLAILEYLDEAYPAPPLLPKDLRDRAHVRALSYTVAVDAHPFVVPRVRKYLEQELRVGEDDRMKWLRHWLDSATEIMEQMLTRDQRTGRFCCGDQPTLADACLIPHITSAQMLYGCDLGQYPTVQRIVEACMQIQAFADAHPLNQADAQQA